MKRGVVRVGGKGGGEGVFMLGGWWGMMVVGLMYEGGGVGWWRVWEEVVL